MVGVDLVARSGRLAEPFTKSSDLLTVFSVAALAPSLDFTALRVSFSFSLEAFIFLATSAGDS